jgi:hypothetical protein
MGGGDRAPMHRESEKTPCGFKKASGGECKAFALPSGRCWIHDPDRADQRHQARSKGAKVRALQSKQPRFDSPKALIQFTGLILSGVLSGRIAPDVGRVVLYGVNTQRALLETSDLVARLEALEAAAEPAQHRSGRR